MIAQDRGVEQETRELDPLVRALKAKLGEDDLGADVEIHAKAGHWVLEFPQDVTVQDDVTFALKVVDRGLERARQLQNGQSPWTSQKGKVALGFYSPLDGSVQPLLVTIPAAYDGKPTRLDTVLHGRSQRLIESNWICYDPLPANAQTGERLLTQAAGSCLQPSPNAAGGGFERRTVPVEVFARGNNANHGRRSRRVRVYGRGPGASRLTMPGSCSGGFRSVERAPGTSRCTIGSRVGAEIGAGTWPRRYLMMDQFPPHQRPTLRILETDRVGAHAFNIPIAGHDGAQRHAGRVDSTAARRRGHARSARVFDQDSGTMAREGYPYEGEPTSYVAKGTPGIFLISENTGHSTSPKVRQRLDAFLNEWTDRGLQSPDHIRFLTYTTRYNKSFWVTIDGLGQHYERAEVDARRLSGGSSYQIKTTNVSRLVLRETDKATEIEIDGQTVRVKPGRELALEKSLPDGAPRHRESEGACRRRMACRVRLTMRSSIRSCWCAPPARPGTRPRISTR